MLEQLRNTKSIVELIDFVKDIYKSCDQLDYIPALINQGSFTAKSGEDFYLKLVICHQKTEIKETWMTSNLSFGLISPDFDGNDNIYSHLKSNVIVTRKVKGKSLYQLNPNITNERITEYEYDNNTHVNMFYNKEYSTQKGLPVLRTEGNKDIHVLKRVFENYLNEPTSNTYPKYRLIAEIEYRTYWNKYDEDEAGKYPVDGSYFDVYFDGKSMQIRGSIDLGVLELSTSVKSCRAIKVLSLDKMKYRDHNPSNFNDDMNAGFVIFDIGIMEVIKSGYYIYDLVMYDKENIENRFMIDIMDDKVVFWEGEYNKLPTTLKNKIDEFNLILSEPKGVISHAMSAWQLEVDWNFQRKMYPEQKLASEIEKKHFGAAIDLGISFHVPANVSEFKDFVTKLEKLTRIKLEEFDSNNNEVRLLIQIREGYNVSLSYDDLALLYRKYCYQIGKKANYELFR